MALFFVFNYSELALDSKVALKRDVVEDMLIQRFKNRIHGVSDEELAQITERLLAEQATFPTDLLLLSPGQQQQQQQRSRQQPTPTPPPKVTIDTSTNTSELEEEEDDDTADLLATLGNVAADGVVGAAAGTVSDAITNNWTPQILRVAKAVSVGAGLAATVPAASALQRKFGKNKSSDSGGSNSSPSTSPPRSSGTTEAEKKESSTGGIGGFMSWVFGDDVPEKQPETNSITANNTPSSDVAKNAVAGASLQREEEEELGTPPSYGDQVLWRKKEDTAGSSSTSTSNSSNGVGGGVLWRRNEKADEKDKVRYGNSNQMNGSAVDQQQQDLWRVPIESLRSPANGKGEDAPERPAQVARKPVAPSPRPVPVVEKGKVVDGFSGAGIPKLSESALDNAEPPDFVANGVHKL